MISKDMQDKIIDLFCNTESSMTVILRKVAPNNEISLEELYDFIENYRTDDGKRITRKGRKRKLDFLKDEIYELRKKGLTYEEILEYYKEKGIDTNITIIQNRCNEIYMEKVEKHNSRKRLEYGRRFDKNVDNIILNLRDRNYTYEQISKYLKKSGIDMSTSTVSNRCRAELFNRKYRNKTDKVYDEDIVELRKRGMTYIEIKDQLCQTGFKVPMSKIESVCKAYDKNASKVEPVLKNEDKKTYRANNYIDLPDEYIYELKENGLSYREIAKRLTKEGIEVCYETVRKRCKLIYQEKNDAEPPRAGEKGTSETSYQERIVDVMFEVAKKRKATKQQFKRFAKEISEHYKINIDCTNVKERSARDSTER